MVTRLPLAVLAGCAIVAAGPATAAAQAFQHPGDVSGSRDVTAIAITPDQPEFWDDSREGFRIVSQFGTSGPIMCRGARLVPYRCEQTDPQGIPRGLYRINTPIRPGGPVVSIEVLFPVFPGS